jgi:hypothetical protein
MLERGIKVWLGLVALMGSAGAQATRQSGAADGDMAELQAYRLTVPVLQKITEATTAFARAVENDPKFKEYSAAQRELKALENKPEPTEADGKRIEELEARIEKIRESMKIESGNPQTLTDMERTFAKVPHLPAALQSVGLTPREFAKFQLAAFQAGMVAGMKKAGQTAQLPPGISAENVQFMVDHGAEVAAMGKAMKSVSTN